MSGTPPIDLKTISSLGEALIGTSMSYTPTSLPATSVKIGEVDPVGSSPIDDVVMLVDHANYRVAFFSAVLGLFQGVPDTFKRLMQG